MISRAIFACPDRAVPVFRLDRKKLMMVSFIFLKLAIFLHLTISSLIMTRVNIVIFGSFSNNKISYHFTDMTIILDFNDGV